TLGTPLVASFHTATSAGDGSVIVIGGDRGQSVLSDSVDRFDPASRVFTHIGSLRSGRMGHTATRLPDGRILVVGGTTSLRVGNAADLVDERTGAVSDGGQFARPRVGHAATLLSDGRVLVTGGLGQETAEIWDPATGSSRLLSAHMTN